MSYWPRTVRIEHFLDVARKLSRFSEEAQEKDKRIAELEKQLAAQAEEYALMPWAKQNERIAELGLQYNAQAEEIDALETLNREQFERIAELEPDAKAYRKLCDIRKGLPGIPCACEFDDDNEVLRWCNYHAELKERIAELESQLASIRVLNSALATRDIERRAAIKALQARIDSLLPGTGRRVGE